MSLYEQKHRFPREPVSMTVTLLLGAGGLAAGGAGLGTGVTAMLESRDLERLQKAMVANLKAIEKSMSTLEKSLTSLSEVVLQNRRGLDLLFLKEGGLRAALKEECCFNADHTGIVWESMTKHRERLAQREQELEAREGWFNGVLWESPWLSTLIPTVLEPLLIILLAISLGPWAVQQLTQFIKKSG